MKRALALAVPIRRLSLFISSHFVAIYSWSVHRSRKSQNNTRTPYFAGFKVI